MAHMLDMKVVAEGVETVDQHRETGLAGVWTRARATTSLGPMPAGEFETLLQQGPAWAAPCTFRHSPTPARYP